MTTNGHRPGIARPPKRTLWIAGGIGAAIIVVAAAVGIVLAVEGVGIPNRQTPLPGLITGKGPWGPNTDQLRPRLDRLGLELSPAVGLPSGFVRIKLVLDGKHVRIPAGIGAEGGSVAPLYTGAPGGGVLRAPLARVSVRLALFFKIWGVRFTRSCVGGYCGKLSVVVNGAPVPGDARGLLLRHGQEITVSIQR